MKLVAGLEAELEAYARELDRKEANEKQQLPKKVMIAYAVGTILVVDYKVKREDAEWLTGYAKLKRYQQFPIDKDTVVDVEWLYTHEGLNAIVPHKEDLPLESVYGVNPQDLIESNLTDVITQSQIRGKYTGAAPKIRVTLPSHDGAVLSIQTL